MRKTRLWITIGCCFFAVALFAWAQSTRKPGLWEMTSSMTWQQSPLPPGVTLPAGMKSPFSGSTNTMQVCVTQAMIDKYGTAMPKSQNDCKIENVVLNANSMSADMVCSGRMNGKGSMESSWSDNDHTKGKMHFLGAMQGGPNSMPVEWTVEFTSVYQGPDCGSVKPLPMPSN